MKNKHLLSLLLLLIASTPIFAVEMVPIPDIFSDELKGSHPITAETIDNELQTLNALSQIIVQYEKTFNQQSDLVRHMVATCKVSIDTQDQDSPALARGKEYCGKEIAVVQQHFSNYAALMETFNQLSTRIRKEIVYLGQTKQAIEAQKALKENECTLDNMLAKASGQIDDKLQGLIPPAMLQQLTVELSKIGDGCSP